MKCLSRGLCLLFVISLGQPVMSAEDRTTTRIVSLVPSLTEMLYAIGAADQIAAVSIYCHYPPEAQTKPKVGASLNPDLESLIRQRPSVVLLYKSQADLAGKLSNLKIKTELCATDRIAEIYGALDMLGQLTGHESEATSAAETMRHELDEIARRSAKLPPVRALVIVSRDSAGLRMMYQSGANNFLGEILKIAGGVPAVATTAEAVDREQIIAGNPEVIIDLSGGERAADATYQSAAKAHWNELNTVAAVRSGRIHVISDSHALVPGPYLPVIAKKFFDVLHKSAAD